MIIPNPLELLRALIRFIKAALTGRPLLVDHEVFMARVDACAAREGSCYDADSLQCRRCTCFVHAKAQLATEECPAGFWKKELINTRS